MTLWGANQPSIDTYDYFTERFGPGDPRSSGYRSVRAFEFEACVIRKILRHHDGPILDVACGHGLVTAPLAAEGRSVFGIDYNEAGLLCLSQENYRNTRQRILHANQGSIFRCRSLDRIHSAIRFPSKSTSYLAKWSGSRAQVE